MARTQTRVVLLVVSLLLVPAADGVAAVGELGSAQSKAAQPVAAARLVDHPNAFFGKTVRVTAPVAQILGPHAFTLDAGNFLGANPDLLVYVSGAEAMPITGVSVTVTGVVREFRQADIRRVSGWQWAPRPIEGGYEYVWFGPSVDPDYFVHRVTRPFIVATSVTTGSGKELLPGGAGAPTSGAVGTSGSGGEVAPLAAGAPMVNQVNDHVTIPDCTVERVVSQRAFWASVGRGRDVFVALASDLTRLPLHAGERLSISGRILPAPADARQIDATKWQLSAQDVTRLLDSQAFIRADAVMAKRPSRRGVR